MAKRILIDSSHPEERRVAIVNDDNKLEEFEFETTARQTLKGNIYLAKVTRVEPSLQAAFVDYGGNRHGFLAFSEIHPDYYQIPVADKEILEKELAEAQKKRTEEIEDALAEEGEKKTKKSGKKSSRKASKEEKKEIAETVELLLDDVIDIDPEDLDIALDIQTFGGETERIDRDETEEILEETRKLDVNKRYKIQEVIKRNQIILVQIVKEERGNKGAALTTYLSLAGRYSVLMPNTMNAGGISRKIGNSSDRKKLRKILEDLGVEDKQSLIIRTAGQERTKLEIKRDYDYLGRTWDKIRENTLNSLAPAIVHEEGDLVKRSIRDLYTKDVEEVLVEGEEDYKQAKAFMKTLMPSHAKRVQHYKEETVSLFRQYEIENQIEALQQSTVNLPSGGSIVMNPTEALVAIDINSGKATKERDIGETALNTNLEAAVEIARQLRLRDLAGLIVIDFIDMDVSAHISAVERKLRESLKPDRARIQTGRISQFGLLELSRQRLRPSIFETLTQACKTCGGTGHIRSIDSTALAILRSIEEEGAKGRAKEIDVIVPAEIALYLFNKKRTDIEAMEKRFGIEVRLNQDSTLGADEYKVRTPRSRRAQNTQRQKSQPRQVPQKKSTQGSTNQGRKGEKGGQEDEKIDSNAEGKESKDRKRRRNRRRRRSEAKDQDGGSVEQAASSSPQSEGASLKTSDTQKGKTGASPEKNSKKEPQHGKGGNSSRKKKTGDEGKPKPKSKKETPVQQPKDSQPEKKNSSDKPAIVKDLPPVAANEPTSDKSKAPKKGWWDKLIR